MPDLGHNSPPFEGPPGPPGPRQGRRGRGVGPHGWRGPHAAPCPAPSFSEHKRLLLETAVLTALAEKQGHGYALFERVAELLGAHINLDTGSLYRVLRLLEDAGMVTSSWEIGPAGPPRRTYSVTPAGEALLHAHAQTLLEKARQLELLAQAAQDKLKSTN